MTTIKVMVRTAKFRIVYQSHVKEQLHAIDRKHHTLIRDAIELHLRFEPLVQTTNRKPVIQPHVLGATWEIRIGPNNRFRVFYEVDQEKLVVSVLAIGEKSGSRLFIGGEEVSA